MKQFSLLLLILILLVVITGCNSKQAASSEILSVESQQSSIPEETTTERIDAEMKMYINDVEIPVTWENNQSVNALKDDLQMGDIVISMSMYSNNEQFGSLGKTYPSSDIQITTNNGDIVLYSSDQIVVFYGSNSWAYTRLGRIDLLENEVTELLCNGDVTIRLSL